MSTNPRLFMDLSVDQYKMGRIVIEVFADVVPKTAENFRCLCTGEKGFGYKGSLFSGVHANLLHGGDFDGNGGYSIYGPTFADENYLVKPDKPFLLSMANEGKHKNGSQFFLWAGTGPENRYVHFGQVVEGWNTILSIINSAGNENPPTKKVIITDCGQL